MHGPMNRFFASQSLQLHVQCHWSTRANTRFVYTMPLFDSFFEKSPPPTSSVPSLGAVGASVGAAVGAATQRVKLPNFGKNLFRDLQAPHLYIIIGAATLSSLVLIRSVAGSSSSRDPKPIPSPRETLPPEVLRASPYPPDAFEGARDVQTPYGSIRVYEWGPKDGKRVLLIHGMSTPSVALSDLAHKLVKRGCRVMLFGMSLLPSLFGGPPILVIFLLQHLHTNWKLMPTEYVHYTQAASWILGTSIAVDILVTNITRSLWPWLLCCSRSTSLPLQLRPLHLSGLSLSSILFHILVIICNCWLLARWCHRCRLHIVLSQPGSRTCPRCSRRTDSNQSYELEKQVSLLNWQHSS
jgi:hypothetical protein